MRLRELERIRCRAQFLGVTLNVLFHNSFDNPSVPSVLSWIFCESQLSKCCVLLIIKPNWCILRRDNISLSATNEMYNFCKLIPTGCILIPKLLPCKNINENLVSFYLNKLFFKYFVLYFYCTNKLFHNYTVLVNAMW